MIHFEKQLNTIDTISVAINSPARDFHELFLPRLVISLSGLGRHGDVFRNQFSLQLCSSVRFIIQYETREEITLKTNCINRVLTVKSSIVLLH